MLEKYTRLLIICCCLFGLLGLLLLSYFYDSVSVTPTVLYLQEPDDRVYLVTGIVKNEVVKSNTLFFEICDSLACLPCVYFNPASNLSFSGLENTTVKAKYTTYNNSPELVVYSFWK